MNLIIQVAWSTEVWHTYMQKKNK